MTVKRKDEAHPLLIRDVVVLERLTRQDNEIVAFLAKAVITVLRGGIRYEHSLRSTLDTADGGGFASFLCASGKSRKKGGAPPPFNWIVPFVDLEVKGVTQSYVELRSHLFPNEPTFIVPALSPRRSGIATATGFQARGMRRGAFIKTVQALIQYGVDIVQRPIPPPTARSLRRTQTTIAEALGLHLHERLPLGSWIDDVTERAARSRPFDLPTPAVYTGEDMKLAAQVDVKTFVWRAVSDAYAHFGADAMSMQWSGKLKDWLRQWAAEKRGASPMAPLPPATAERSSARTGSHLCESSPSSSSRASSPSSSPRSTSASPCRQEGDAASFEWCFPPSGTKLHRMTNGVPPSCTGSAVIPEPNRGSGFADALLKFPGKRWCLKCAADLNQ